MSPSKSQVSLFGRALTSAQEISFLPYIHPKTFTHAHFVRLRRGARSAVATMKGRLAAEGEANSTHGVNETLEEGEAEAQREKRAQNEG